MVTVNRMYENGEPKPPPTRTTALLGKLSRRVPAPPLEHRARRRCQRKATVPRRGCAAPYRGTIPTPEGTPPGVANGCHRPRRRWPWRRTTSTRVGDSFGLSARAHGRLVTNGSPVGGAGGGLGGGLGR